MAKRDSSLPLKGNAEPYAFARACGYGIWESTRRTGANPETGQGSKWEARADIQARIRWWRTFGQSDEMLAEKRSRIESRLELAAYGNMFDFAQMVERVVTVVGKGGSHEEVRAKSPMIDWDAVAASPMASIISTFKFDKDTGELIHFERDDALAALSQLRDMHGFSAPKRSEFTGKDGGAIKVENYTDADRVKALQNLHAKVERAAEPTP